MMNGEEFRDITDEAGKRVYDRMPGATKDPKHRGSFLYNLFMGLAPLKEEIESLQAALLLAMKRGHHYACPGGREPGTIYHGPCSGRCETIRQALGDLADTESKKHPSEIKKGVVDQTNGGTDAS